ncbi:MAG: metal ABC transporter substrate-binding protein [Alphaproteobacteria bacterium]
MAAKAEKTGKGTPDDDDEGKPAKDATTDPHLWLDPVRMAAIAEPLASRLGQASPANAVTLHYHAEQLATHLREDVDPGVRALLARRDAHAKTANLPTIPFITYHAAYQYFLARYDIAPEGFVTQVPEDYFGAHTLDKTLRGASAVPIRCIISESDSPLVKRLAAESGARIVEQNPERSYSPQETPSLPWIQNNYDRLLASVAASFAGCL